MQRKSINIIKHNSNVLQAAPQNSEKNVPDGN